MSFVCDDDDVLAIRELRVDLAFLRAELLDQRKDVAVIFAEQLLEMSTAGGMGLDLTYSTNSSEGLVDLLVQLVAVGDDHECPVAWDLVQDLLSEEDH